VLATERLHEIARREMQTDTEHQQHHSDLGELPDQCAVGYEPRCETAHGDAAHQITDNRRQSQPVCNKAEEKCECETDRKGGDQ